METIIPYFSNFLRDATSNELRGVLLTIFLIIVYKYVYTPWSSDFYNIRQELKNIKSETDKLLNYTKSSIEIHDDLIKLSNIVNQISKNTNLIHSLTVKNEHHYEFIYIELSKIKDDISTINKSNIESRLAETTYRINMENKIERIIDRLDPVLTALKGIK